MLRDYFIANIINLYINVPVTSPFDISNITEPITFYVVANNIAGTVISEPVTGTPLLIGNPPVINSLLPGVNSITVKFSGSINSVPPPYAYYYSLDGGEYILATPIQSQILITGLNVIRSYAIRLIAENEAGFTLPSNTLVGTPRPEGVVLEFNNTPSVSKVIGNSAESNGTYSQDRKKFINVPSISVDPNLPLEVQQEYTKRIYKKRILETARYASSDITVRKRISAFGRAVFSKPTQSAGEIIYNPLTSRTIKRFSSSKNVNADTVSKRKTNRVRDHPPILMNVSESFAMRSERRISFRRESTMANKRRTNRMKHNNYTFSHLIRPEWADF